jgi:hypothetical protein
VTQRQVTMESMLRLHMEENDTLRKRLLVAYDTEHQLTELNKQLTAELEAYKAQTRVDEEQAVVSEPSEGVTE